MRLNALRIVGAAVVWAFGLGAGSALLAPTPAQAAEIEVVSDNDLLTLPAETDKAYSRISPGKPATFEVIGPGNIRLVIRANVPPNNLKGAVPLSVDLRNKNQSIRKLTVPRAAASDKSAWAESTEFFPSDPKVLEMEFPAGRHEIRVMALDSDLAGGAVAGVVSKTPAAAPAGVAAASVGAAGGRAPGKLPTMRDDEPAPLPKPQAKPLPDFAAQGSYTADEKPSRFPYKAVGWTLFGAGLATAGAGAAMNVVSLGKVDDANAQPYQSAEQTALVDESKGAWTTAIALYSAGAAVAATGLVLVIVDAVKGDGPISAQNSAAWPVTPGVAVATGGGQLTLGGRF